MLSYHLEEITYNGLNCVPAPQIHYVEVLTLDFKLLYFILTP